MKAHPCVASSRRRRGSPRCTYHGTAGPRGRMRSHQQLYHETRDTPQAGRDIQGQEWRGEASAHSQMFSSLRCEFAMHTQVLLTLS